MAKRVNISAARRELPSLFDRVTGRDGEKVLIRRRDGGREAVLVSRDYVERLERQSARAAAPFRLIASGELLMPVEQVIGDLRSAERREAEKRGRELQPGARRR